MRREGSIAWLTWTAIAAAPCALAFYVYEQWGFLHGRLDRGQVVGRDFLNYWSGARLFLEGRTATVFQPGPYGRALTQLWGPGLALHNFSYPPTLLPLIGWTGWLGYGTAFALWTVLGLAALLAACWPVSRRLDAAALLVLSPAVLACLDVGQNGLFTGALLVGGLRLSDRRPWLGGALIGLVSFKPQLALLIPIALIAAGRWRVMAGAAASALALAAVATAMAGMEAWRLYFTVAGPFQQMVLEHRTGAFQIMMPGPFMAGRLLGLPLAASYAVQAAASLACIVLIWRHFSRLRREGRPIAPLDIALLLAGGFVASPYGFNYDMAGLTAALLLAGRTQPALDASRAWPWGAAALWWAPLLMMVVPMAMAVMHLPVLPAGPVLTVVGLALVGMTVARSSALSAGSRPSPG